MGSASDKISGNTKQAAGKASGDKKMEMKGKIEETKGKAKDKMKEFSDKI